MGRTAGFFLQRMVYFCQRPGISDITKILEAAADGDSQAAEQLLPLVYEELRSLASRKMAQERPDQTIQATALVHEAWLRLAGPGQR